jgi:ElaB/YqjD/DUF883 family membrane-anchored ribosome-binding protein
MNVERSMEGLIEEMHRLRAEFSKISEALVGFARHRTNEAAAKVRHAAEDSWGEARGAVEGVSKRIEEQPLVATAVAFAIGALIGIVFLTRKR